MMKHRLLSVLISMAMAVTMCVVVPVSSASAASTTNPDTSDYKYSHIYDNGVAIYSTDNLFGVACAASLPEKVGEPAVMRCMIVLPKGNKFEQDATRIAHASVDIAQEWDFGTYDNVAYVTAQFNSLGVYDLEIKSKAGLETRQEFKVGPCQPKAIRVTTYPNKISFFTYNQKVSNSGEATKASVNGHEAELVNGLGESQWIKNAGFNPGGKYDIKLQSFGMDADKSITGPKYTLRGVPMGPKTTPVIQSVKFSNVKVKKYYDKDEKRYKHKTSCKMTVTLSKKASGTKGAYIQVKDTSGLASTRCSIKGTGKTFSSTITIDAPKSCKGVKVKVTATTYSDLKYGCYSYESKAKAATI